MPGVAAGFGAPSLAAVAGIPGGPVAATASLLPGPDWNGSADTGWDTRPSDPARITAKPVVRIVTPPSQRNTGKLTVAVFAAANNGGSLLDNFGMRQVIFHLEGNKTHVHAPGIAEFTREDGSLFHQLVWQVEVHRPIGQTGTAHLYIEAVPADSTMQNRVIGPFPVIFADTLHDYDLEVAPLQEEVPGIRYRSVKAAGTYLKNALAQAPRIRITEAHDVDASQTVMNWPQYAGSGYLTIEATVPGVNFTRSSRGTFRPAWRSVWFKNCDFDFATIQRIVIDAVSERQPVIFEHCRFYDTNAPGQLYDGTLPGSYSPTSQRTWMIGCRFDGIRGPLREQHVAIGNICNESIEDVLTSTYCAFGNVVSGLNNSLYRASIDALQVRYTGPAQAASLERTGSIASATYRARVDGESIGTFSAVDGTHLVSDVADWLNGLADWTATTLDDTRSGAALFENGRTDFANWGPIDVKSAEVTFQTRLDVHGDFYQQVSAMENIACLDNLAFGIDAQFLLLGTGGLKDALFANLAIEMADNPANTGNQSQLSGSQSHVMIAHTSFARQNLLLRAGAGSYSPDRYCRIANSVTRAITWEGDAVGDLTIAGNHTYDASIAPEGATDHTIGGDQDDLFVDAASGDFTPTGALLLNPAIPSIRYDLHRVARATMAMKGAVS